MKRVLRWIVLSLATVVLGVVGLGVATVLAFAFVPAVGTPSQGEFHQSVADAAGGRVNKCCMRDGCAEVSPRAWECSVSDTSLSGGVEYRVRRRGSRCWDARRVAPDGWEGDDPPARMSDCVKLGDQFWASSAAPW